MDIKSTISELAGKIDKDKIAEVTSKINEKGAIGDLDGDGEAETPLEEIKGKIGSLFGKK